MQLNVEDGGHRKFIMVQLPEACDEKSEAFKAGYSNICEIGKERIRRAAKKIREDAGLSLPQDFDGGFRCLRPCRRGGQLVVDRAGERVMCVYGGVKSV